MTLQPQLIPITQDITAKDIIAALDDRYQYNQFGQWFGIAEARMGAGYAPGHERRIDYLAIHQHPSRGHIRLAFEVKVSRGDFLKELKQPKKRRLALMFSTQFYFVTPPGLVQVSELPPECGLMECNPFEPEFKKRFVTRMGAPERDSLPPTWSLVVSLLRNEHTRVRRELEVAS